MASTTPPIAKAGLALSCSLDKARSWRAKRHLARRSLLVYIRFWRLASHLKPLRCKLFRIHEMLSFTCRSSARRCWRAVGVHTDFRRNSCIVLTRYETTPAETLSGLRPQFAYLYCARPRQALNLRSVSATCLGCGRRPARFFTRKKIWCKVRGRLCSSGAPRTRAMDRSV